MTCSSVRRSIGASFVALVAACGSSETSTPGIASDTSSTSPPAVADAGTSTAPAAVDASDPAAPSVFMSGRFDSQNGVSWSGARIRANFSGTSVSATLDEGGTSYFDVMIDGTLTQTIALTAGTSTYSLASGLAAGNHTVELYRRSEPIYGITTFVSFDFGDGQLLATPSPFTHKLEFLGDSLTAGFGVECSSASETNTAATQNEHKSFASIAADSLNAEHYNLAYSGTGVYWNYIRTDPQVYGLDYPLTHPAEPQTSPNWDFTRYTPDVVWLMIGSNDWDEVESTDPPPPLDGYIEKYQELVTFVRAQYPNAELFLAVPPDATNDYPVGYNDLTNLTAAVNAIKSAQNALGDMRVTTFSFTNSNRDVDLTGCASHPNAARQASMAAEAAAAIKQTMNW